MQVALVTFSAVSEMGTILAEGKLQVVWDNLWLFVLSATLGLAVNLASFLVVQTTSSVMLKILGTVRNAGLVLFQVSAATA